jgi:hypothetical protein
MASRSHIDHDATLLSVVRKGGRAWPGHRHRHHQAAAEQSGRQMPGRPVRKDRERAASVPYSSQLARRTPVVYATQQMKIVHVAKRARRVG